MISFFKKNDQKIIFFLCVLLALACAYRLLLLIATYAVNLLYWDHFELYRAFIEKASFWETFRWQHGSHRQGLSFLLTRLLAGLSGWNTNAESYLVLFFMTASAFLLLALKRRLYGKFHLTDMILPVLVLSPAELEIYMNTPNASHGAFPLFGILVFSLSWTSRNDIVKIGGSLLSALIVSHSGFGLFFPLLFPVVLCVKTFSSGDAPAIKTRYRIALLSSLLIPLLFFLDYDWSILSEASGGNLWNAFLFVFIMSAHAALGFFTENVTTFAVTGAVLFFYAFLTWTRIARIRVFTKPSAEDPVRGEIEFLLLGFSLVFMVAASLGRASMDLNNALNSRYYPYLVPGLAALYFHCLDHANRLRLFKLAAFLLLFVSLARVRPEDMEAVRKTRDKKLIWATVYRKTENVGLTNRVCGFRLNVARHDALMQKTFDYCKRNRLNLYSQE